MKSYLYIFMAVLLLGCQDKSFPNSQPAFLLSTYTSKTPVRHFDDCIIRYSFENSPKNLDINAQQKTLEIPFDLWEAANGYIELRKVPSGTSAHIRFVFTDSVSFQTAPFSLGLVRQSVTELSTSVREKDGSYTVYLRNSHNWDLNRLQRALLFQIGAVLGLATSDRPQSAMHATFSGLLKLDSTDVKAIGSLYNQSCDQWTRLEDVPFDARNLATQFSANGKGYLIIRGSTNNVVWEYSPETNNWQKRKSYPGNSNSNFPVNLSSFVVDTHAYVGQAFEFASRSQPGEFWKYQPATSETEDRWTRVADIPFIGDQNGFTLSIGNKGYVYTATPSDSTFRSNLIVWEYDTDNDKWQQPLRYERVNNFGFPYNDLSGFTLGNSAYLIKINEASSVRFSPLDASPWINIPSPIGNSYTSTAFAVKNGGYSVNGWYDPPKNVARYEPATGWRNMKPMQANGRIGFSFVGNNRVYIGTDIGEFWMYRP